ncbi:MAG: chaperone modulator CbpM [Spirochaetia bacterium]|nr:chaperone modulator CbpM [Spirochaetia bacterium]
MDRQLFKIEEAARQCSIETTIIVEWIQNEWIMPAEPDNTLDEEDLARIQLILNLRSEFGVNDEAIPIILGLLDQLHHLHHRLRQNTDRT